MEKKSKLYTGSVCLTDLIEQAKKQHSAFSKGKNGKVYANILQWENEGLDKYGNSHSIQLNSLKEKKDAEGKIYIGNLKPVEMKSSEAFNQADVKSIADSVSDLPF